MASLSVYLLDPPGKDPCHANFFFSFGELLVWCKRKPQTPGHRDIYATSSARGNEQQTRVSFFLSRCQLKKNTTAAPISVVQYKIQQKISRSFLWDYDHALCCHVVLSSKSRGSCYDMSSCQLLDFKWVSKELYVFSLKSFIFLFGSTLELKATKKENHGQNDHQIRHPS